MNFSSTTLETSATIEDVTRPSPSWSPSWLSDGKVVIPSGAARTPEVPSSPPSSALAPPRARVGWRAELRAWPKPRRDEWADLVELGEDEGLPFREAEELAYLILAVVVAAEPPPPTQPSASFDGWVPTEAGRDPRDPRDGGRKPLPTNPRRPIWLKIPRGPVVPLGDKHQAKATRWCEEGTAVWHRFPAPLEA